MPLVSNNIANEPKFIHQSRFSICWGVWGMTKSKIEGCIFGKRGAQLFDFFLKSGPQSVEEQGVNERKGRTRFLGGGREW